jgi:phage RecT family recombinase
MQQVQQDVASYYSGILNSCSNEFNGSKNVGLYKLNFNQEAAAVFETLMGFYNQGNLMGVPDIEIKNAFLKGVGLGLSFAQNDGSAFVVCNWNEFTQRCQVGFYLGYKGMYDLVARSEIVKNIQARTVYDNDVFIEHGRGYPTHDITYSKPRGEVLTAYAVSPLADESIICTVLAPDQMKEIESMARQTGNSAWNSNYVDVLRKKTAVRHHFHTALRSVMNLKLTDQETIGGSNDGYY